MTQRSTVRRNAKAMLVASVALASVAFVGARPPLSQRLAETASRQFRQQTLDGIYSICGGAYAHVEALVLRDSSFEHFILSHGRMGGRSRGTFTRTGDTLSFDTKAGVPETQADSRSRWLYYPLVIGTYRGLRVLWRGGAPESKDGTDEYPGQVGQYHALFYSGPDSTQLQVPPCSTFRK